MSPSSFTKKERILKRADFVTLKRRGKRGYAKGFIIITTPNRGNITRLGITVSKRVGNAAKRNRLKRLIREFFRLHKNAMPKGYDIMIVALKEDGNLTFSNVRGELGSLLEKNGNLFS
jgi:ribonuclease P protein component